MLQLFHHVLLLSSDSVSNISLQEPAHLSARLRVPQHDGLAAESTATELQGRMESTRDQFCYGHIRTMWMAQLKGA